MRGRKDPFRQMTKKVIDADNQIILEYFAPVSTRLIKSKYQMMNKWDDISVDKNGDIILWEK
jgi:hypothetical protein